MFFLGGVCYYVRECFEKNNLTEKFNLKNYHLILIFLMYLLLIFANTYLYESKIDLLIYFLVIITVVIISTYKIDTKKPKFLENKFLLFYGEISYSFYLLHFPIFLLLPKTNLIFLDFLFSLIVTTLLAKIWAKYFEIKFYSKIKSRILKNS